MIAQDKQTKLLCHKHKQNMLINDSSSVGILQWTLKTKYKKRLRNEICMQRRQRYHYIDMRENSLKPTEHQYNEMVII